MIRETCHCGHDKASHYHEVGKPGAGICLCRGCECGRYAYEGEPRPALAMPLAIFWKFIESGRTCTP